MRPTPDLARLALAALASSPKHIAVLDATGCIVAVNQRWRSFAQENGADLERVCEGVNYLAVCDAACGDDSAIAQQLADEIRRLVAGPAPPVTLEYPCHSPQQPRWFTVTAHRFAGNGEPYVSVVHNDITDKRISEIALHEQERLYRATFNQVGVGLAHVGRDGRFLKVNSRLATILGQEAGELLGRSLKDFTDRDEWASISEAIDAVLRGQCVDLKLSQRWRKMLGQSVWVELTGTLLRHDDPRRDFLILVVEDISRRVQAESQLQRFYLALEQSSESILITDLDARIEYVNAAFTVHSGYSKDEAIGCNPSLLQSGKTSNAIYHQMWRQLTAGERWQGEFLNRRKDGTEYIEAAVVSPIRRPDGSITHYVAVNRDVTESRRVALELETYRTQLEDLVSKRTRELNEARLQAEAASQAKSLFLANMSHEIRTPMNGVLGMLDVLTRSHLSEQQAEAVWTASESGRTLLGIIDDILDFSKIEAGKLELERVPTPLADLVEGVCDSLVPLSERRGVDLSLFVAPTLPHWVLADGLRLRQVLFNLIGNAIKFSASEAGHRGRVSVRVTASPGAESPQLRFEVIDNGIGMAPDTIHRLFMPFTQADAATTRRFGGTGLGLTICKRLADLMGARIDVQSELGQGSKFTINVPAEVAERSVAAEPIPPIAGLECIVVEAFEFDVNGVCETLQFHGAHVHRVADTRAAARIGQGLPAPVIVIRFCSAGRFERNLRNSGLRQVLLGRPTVKARSVKDQSVVWSPGAVLRPQALLRAVATAAGRVAPEVITDGGDKGLVKAGPPLTLAEARVRGELILVAEDDEVNRTVVRRQLELMGRTAEIACNGKEALQKWCSEQYGLVITDLHMPMMDGYALTSQIRNIERIETRPRTPIVALTANALRGEAEAANAVGIDVYLTKPLQFEQLKQVIDRLLPAPVSRVADATKTDVLNDDALAQVVGSDPAAIREVLAIYLAGDASLQSEIQAAFDRRDLVEVKRLTHKLKGRANSIGAHSLGQWCARLETEIEKGTQTQLTSECYAGLKRAAELVDHEVRHRVNGDR